MERAGSLAIVTLIALLSFAAYAAVGYLTAWLIGFGPARRLLVGAALPLALYGLARVFERISPMSTHGEPSGFIRIKLGWHHLWFAPGFLLVRWLR